MQYNTIQYNIVQYNTMQRYKHNTIHRYKDTKYSKVESYNKIQTQYNTKMQETSKM